MQQEIALRKTRLLAPKAESELQQLEREPKLDERLPNTPAGGEGPSAATSSETPAPVDSEAIKAGYQKALELAPRAVQEMESAAQRIGKHEREQAAVHAEEARRILQEIEDAQPKNPQQDQKDQEKQQDKDKDKQDQKSKDDGKEKQEAKDKNEDKKEDKNEDKKDKDQKDQKQSDEKKQGEEEKKGKDKNGDQRQEPKVSRDRIEEALRRVREREQEKRDRDRELKSRIMERVPVDKDW